VIRKPKESDLERVYQIECESFPLPWEDELFKLLTHRNGRAQAGLAQYLLMDVLDEESIVIGYVIWKENHLTSKGHVLNIAIECNKRRKGYGKRLLHHAFSKMRECGISECILEVRVSNKIARALYESSGMTFHSLEADYYGDEDAAIYIINL
jgi:ribosomal-protein-alanine acetyltransferase